jgi:hypothetical protein
MLNCPLQFCSDNFVLISALRRHFRVHSNNGTLDFPIMCDLCQERLSTVSIYIRHMKNVQADAVMDHEVG